MKYVILILLLFTACAPPDKPTGQWCWLYAGAYMAYRDADTARASADTDYPSYGTLRMAANIFGCEITICKDYPCVINISGKYRHYLVLISDDVALETSYGVYDPMWFDYDGDTIIGGEYDGWEILGWYSMECD